WPVTPEAAGSSPVTPANFQVSAGLAVPKPFPVGRFVTQCTIGVLLGSKFSDYTLSITKRALWSYSDVYFVNPSTFCWALSVYCFPVT
ncbi:MAG: hypothetical protein VX007_10600, partial [Pseudomonadota bacterium]|nr:hypothetical protein [Pseudomonadota bacterium]